MTPLSDRMQSIANALADADELTTLGGIVNAEAFVDVLEHAAALAAEAEHAADVASTYGMTYVAPAYPPLVRLIAHATEVTA